MKALLALVALFEIAACTAEVVPAPINLLPPPPVGVVVAPAPVVVAPPIVVYRGYRGGWRH